MSRPRLAPIPHGMAKAIIAQMQEGDARIVRREHATTFYLAARDLGFSVNFRRDPRKGERGLVMRRLARYSPMRTALRGGHLDDTVALRPAA